MAKVGQAITTPEEGWKRVDDLNPFLVFEGGNWYSQTTYQDQQWNKEAKYATAETMPVLKFKFKGSKLRLICQQYSGRCTTLQCIIDGTSYSFSEAGEPVACCMVFEKTGLANGEHTVNITPLPGSTGSMTIDAIDIDDFGEVIPYYNLSINVVAGDSQVAVSWSRIEGAKSYTVKRSTTAGGPYVTIATTVSDASYIDKTAVNGTTYYYVVTALIANDQSLDSNESSATPKAGAVSPQAGGNILLRVVLTDSSEREYLLKSEDVNAFISWYNRTVNTGNTCYKFSDLIDGSTEYLAFEKIISFKTLTLK